MNRTIQELSRKVQVPERSQILLKLVNEALDFNLGRLHVKLVNKQTMSLRQISTALQIGTLRCTGCTRHDLNHKWPVNRLSRQHAECRIRRSNGKQHWKKRERLTQDFKIPFSRPLWLRPPTEAELLLSVSLGRTE